MRKITCFFLLSLFLADYVHASSNEMIICNNCRNPTSYPQDYGNHAYNLSMGANRDSTLHTHVSNGGIFEVRNPLGQSTLVDINAVTTSYSFTILGYEIVQTVQLNYLEIVVQKADGTQVKYSVFPSTSNLTVGVGTYGNTESNPDTTGGGGAGEAGEDDDDYTDGLPDVSDYDYGDYDYDDCSACYIEEEL